MSNISQLMHQTNITRQTFWKISPHNTRFFLVFSIYSLLKYNKKRLWTYDILQNQKVLNKKGGADFIVPEEGVTKYIVICF